MQYKSYKIRLEPNNKQVTLFSQHCGVARHADDHTLYMHAGNTVIDVYDAKSKWAVEQFIFEMEYHLKRLKNLKKEL